MRCCLNVPYNYDETTGTDVTVTVTADTGYAISNKQSYTTNDTSTIATKTVTLTSDSSVLTSVLLTTLPDVEACYVLTVNIGTGGQDILAAFTGRLISETRTDNLGKH